MEARPFKDTNYDLRKAQLEAAVQAVPRLQEAAVQVCEQMHSMYSSSCQFVTGLLVLT
jgi:hypothetical protein